MEKGNIETEFVAEQKHSKKIIQRKYFILLKASPSNMPHYHVAVFRIYCSNDLV